ncbi:putative capsular polysaccharide synthesis family protein [Desulfurivibrio sp. D14AmB]|uniref:putative capsular polysaccharide synthesis family protein n=1 Tax=Desulfurivibrio sp. D14AmB TaxID=3374370 RepID=UPI00376EC9BB
MNHLKTVRESATVLISKAPNWLYSVARIWQTIFDRWAINRSIKNGTPLILIYQYGRVASTSLYTSLLAADLKFPVYHVHTISSHRASQRIAKVKERGHRVDRYMVLGKIIGEKIVSFGDSPPAQPWKIITVFRDPVSVMISLHFMNVSRYFADILGKNGELDTQKAIEHFQQITERDDPSGWAISTWFDDVFYDELGVDVYSHDFDKDRGYKIINDPRFDILLLRFENLDQAFNEGVAKLFNLDNHRIKLLHSHLHKDDKYLDLQNYVKNNLKLSNSACDKIYSTKFAQHFYSPELISKLTKKWSG